ncbi:Major Facilitator Superfamily protein [Coccidioides posadasii C735 delta SOWgp]|uniref:Major Facilitator Superfamily protein n=2 Tax=Coccidioides posadasii TaxID=199306 RepID=C5PHP4_COCP7|nr:Major Facilitator Superfamily protein [Coccidioides posadasii C735 delta SOWgp]EER24047.1 Major Facilitator Superfamily protein [Coccidioides posadasii C735 delta SOWgp]|eukprot:XP_003066192.1 Major Facilitator Superfamily protein [Coccidioides posadasii C735 delta SOWgp]
MAILFKAKSCPRDQHNNMADGGDVLPDSESTCDSSSQEYIKDPSKLTPEELVIEKQLRWKIDVLIMPTIICVYLMNYIDRNNYAAARLQGLERDLKLTPSQYQTGLSILFVSYILMQVPSNLLLNYVGRPSLYLGFSTIAWGLVSASTSLVKNYPQILACRLILGFVEAPFFAGVLFYLSKWYTKKELTLRMSIFYSGSLLSGAFGNLIAAGILNGLSGSYGLSPWQWLYIIEGIITIAIGSLICVILPDFPDTWRLLTSEMKCVANRRLAIDAAEADIDGEGGMSQLTGFRLAITDIKTYLLAIAYMSITGASGFQNFFPTLTATLGHNETISLLLVAPPYIFTLVYSILHSRMSDRLGSRFWFFIYPIPISILGFIIFMTTDSFGPRYLSLFIMSFVFTMMSTCYSWVAGAIPRPPAKRATAYAFINSVGNSASIWTPYTYRDRDAPQYRLALGLCIALQMLAGLMAVMLRLHLIKQNCALERTERECGGLVDDERMRLISAETEGVEVDIPAPLRKGFRYMI